MNIKENYERIKSDVYETAIKCGRNYEEIIILAVSKTHPVELILQAKEAGIEHFGENYAQELKEKYEKINQMNAKQPKWHFIGHLQSNKVKYIAPFIYLIHSVDSLSLAQEISRQAEKHNRKIDILIQINTSNEPQKSGCKPEEALNLIGEIKKINNINICGLMTIGSFSDDMDLVRSEFVLLRKVFEDAKKAFPELNLKHLSMGMSNDYKIAIEEGSTIIRIGTAIFGERKYV